MSLYDDIQKLSKIPETNENVVFIRREESDIVKRNPKLRKLRPPRNENVSNCIASANCGINYSNEKLEEHWKIRQKKASLYSKDTSFEKNIQSDNCDHKNLTTEISNENTKIEDKDNIENVENILKKCRLNKNAVIKGLLKSQKISINDLYVPNDSIDKKDNMLDENIPSSSQENYIVQCPEASEVFVPSLQLGPIAEDKYKDIDFTVPHIGKKKAITPLQFYINMDDSEFNFVKT
ncbi:unnamed protein product, partial [Heterotrigona itama]